VFDPVRLDVYNPSPMTGAGNLTYLLVGDGGSAVLIDAGVGDPRHLAAIAAALDERKGTLASVLVTHGHSDHASGVRALAAAYPQATFFKRLWPDLDSRYPVEWRTLADGDHLPVGRTDDDALVALYTPGHSPDHVVFWHERTRTMFSGDMVVLGRSVTIDASHGGDLREYLDSLKRIIALAPARLLPAHGERIDDPAPLLRGYIGHRLLRERQVVAALAAGRDTLPAIVESIYDGLPAALLPAARENVLAHLRKLQQEARASEEDGRWRSSLP
jgi:hydroxyacylglutathione hydrolase